MPDPKWRPWPNGECPHCGSDLEVFSDEEGYACDRDPLRCVECGCPGSVWEDPDGSLLEDMYHSPRCDCDWCKTHPADGCACGHCTESEQGKDGAR